MNAFQNIGTILCDLRKKYNLNQQEVANCLRDRGFSVTNQAVCKWETGTTSPNAAQFLTLCTIFEVEDILYTFSAGRYGTNTKHGKIARSNETIEDLSDLNKPGRKLVSELIDVLKESPRYSILSQPIVPEPRTLPVYTIPEQSEGFSFLHSNSYDLVEVNESTPQSANYGIHINGDSMSPKFHAGDTAWIKVQSDLLLGEFGLFQYDQRFYLRQLTSKDQYTLHALNNTYKDIIVSPELPFCILGKVLS